MITVTVTLSEDYLHNFQDLAKQFNIQIEQLLQVSFEELIAGPQEDFQKALECVFGKNRELYPRSA